MEKIAEMKLFEVFLTIIQIQLGALQYLQSPQEARFVDVKEHKKIENEKYPSIRGLTEVQCVGHCTLTEDCHSVNYHGDDQICLVIDEIFDESEGDSHLVHAPGWRYFKKTVVKPQVRFET